MAGASCGCAALTGLGRLGAKELETLQAGHRSLGFSTAHVARTSIGQGSLRALAIDAASPAQLITCWRAPRYLLGSAGQRARARQAGLLPATCQLHIARTSCAYAHQSRRLARLSAISRRPCCVMEYADSMKHPMAHRLSRFPAMGKKEKTKKRREGRKRLKERLRAEGHDEPARKAAGSSRGLSGMTGGDVAAAAASAAIAAWQTLEQRRKQVTAKRFVSL